MEDKIFWIVIILLCLSYFFIDWSQFSIFNLLKNIK